MSRLQVVGWNTCGIAKKGFQQFIDTLDQELSSWDMCAIIEWTKSPNWPTSSKEGHKIFLGAPQDGLNRAGLLVHKNFTGSLGDFKSRGRTVALNFEWQGKKYCILTSHLHPYHDMEEYRKDLEDVRTLTEMARDRIILWMVDAQTSLRATDEDGRLIGANTSNERNAKTEFFVDAVNAMDVRLLNTWRVKNIHNWTCAWKHREARQIDFFGASRTFAHQCTAHIFDSAATNSDHRALLLSFKGDPRPRIRTRRTQPKPIGWRLTDRAYCEDIKASCNIMSSGIPVVDGSNAWHLWCDGGTRTVPTIGHRNRRTTIGAGWGFCLFPKGCQTPTCREEAILTRKGPVVLETSSSLYTGATRLTNNTAEMSAMIEICWFLLTIHAPHPNCVNTRRNVAIRTGDKVIIHPDSKYAMGIAQGLFLPRENVLMAKLLRHLYGVVQKVFDVSLRWTRGHDGDIGNLLADSLAHDGCAAELPRERDFMPLHWDAEEVVNMLAENDMNQTIPVHEISGAHVKRIKQLERYKRREIEGSTTQPVRAPQPRPSCTLGDLTLAVAEAGHKFGKRRADIPARLPPEDEDKKLLRELAQRRRVTSDSFERVHISKTMNHVQRRIKRLRAQRAVDTARLPKWQSKSGGYGPLRVAEWGEEAKNSRRKTTHADQILWGYLCFFD